MDFNVALREKPLIKEDRGFYVPATTTSTLSLESVKPDFTPYLKRIDEMAADANALEVEGEESLKIAVSLGGEAKKIAKAVDKKRREVIESPSEFVKSVNGFCRQFTDSLNKIEAVLKRKISNYQYQQELERRKREEIARKATKELQEKLKREVEEANRKAKDADASAEEIKAPVVQEPILPKETGVIRTETGTSAHQRKVWKAEITDDNLVPREYCIPDIKKINEAVRMGVREITGVRIFEETMTVFRS